MNNIMNHIMENRNDPVRELLSNLSSMNTDQLKQFVNITKQIKDEKPIKKAKKVV